MKVNLYEPFQHWYHGGTIWLISDTHFGDPDCQLMNTNWPTPTEQIKLINSCVGKYDTIIHLGDVGDENWIHHVKGYKVLLLGNHDKGKSNYEKLYTAYKVSNDNGHKRREYFFGWKSLEEIQEDIGEYQLEHNFNILLYEEDNGMFDEVYEGPLFINDKICLSHEPIDLKFGINIHGHCHNGEQSIYHTCEYSDVNIAADVREFKPVRLDKLIGEFKTKDLHRVTIDNAKKNPIHKEK